MNSSNQRIHLCTLDEYTVLTQEIAAHENDLLAFCAVGDVLSAEFDFATSHFGDVPDKFRRVVKNGRLGGMLVTKWAQCLSPSSEATVTIRLLIDEPTFGGMTNKCGTLTVNKSDGCLAQSTTDSPLNTLIDLDRELTVVRGRAFGSVSVLVHPMPAHFVFFRQSQADQRLTYEVQELSGLCFYSGQPRWTPAATQWGLERSDDRVNSCFFPKEQGYMQFVVSVFEKMPNQSRRLFKKFVIQALAM